MYDVLVLPTPVDISAIVNKTGAEKTASKVSAEIFLVVSSALSSTDAAEVKSGGERNSVKVVTFDLLSEKVLRLSVYSFARHLSHKPHSQTKDYSALFTTSGSSGRPQPCVSVFSADSSAYVVTASKKCAFHTCCPMLLLTSFLLLQAPGVLLCEELQPQGEAGV